MITIATLFLVIGAVEKSHVVDWFARKTFGSSGSNLIGKLRMYMTCFSLSIFFNNTPLVAILLPVVKDWGRMRNISASQLLIPLSFSVLAGSFGSMIGTSTNLTVQGLLQTSRGYSFPFFAPLPIGLACFGALLIYMLVAGTFLLPNNKSGLLRQARDELREYVAEVLISEHSVVIGKSLAEMMASLGVAPSYAVKIRRRSNNNTITEMNTESSSKTEFNRTDNSSIDVNYVQEKMKYWYSGSNKNNIPDRLVDDHPMVAMKDDYFDIIAPSMDEIVRAGDIVFIASAQDALAKMLKSIMGESKGLFILQGNVMSLPGYGSELVEMVISDSNPFVGRRVASISSEFASYYKAAIITVRAKDFGHALSYMLDGRNDSVKDDSESNVPRRKYDTLESNEKNDSELNIIESQTTNNTSSNLSNQFANEEEKQKFLEENFSMKAKELQSKVLVGDHILSYGDTILAVTNEKNLQDLTHSRDFFVVSGVGILPKPLNFYTSIPIFIFVVMITVVAVGIIDMAPAALTVTAVFFMGGWITPQEIPKLVDVRLLMLMGCSISFAKAMTTSGLAEKIASTINTSNPSPYGALLLIYAITLVITELISNNAAAALMFPIAVALADDLGMSFKAAAMAVLVASTAGFMSPIGYQTHVMVWGPGGYRFIDFVIFGFIPDLIYWLLGCAVIAALYPLDEI